MRHRDDRSRSQHDFRIAVEYPTGATLPIKFELTQVEPIFFPVEDRPVVHEFADESFDLSVPVYALDEVVVEKLRAFLQTAVNLDRRDWTTVRGTSTTCGGCTTTTLRWHGRSCVDRWTSRRRRGV
jgi:hypothetical protein